jgi:hypothetical protein
MVRERNAVKGPFRFGQGENEAICMQSISTDKRNLIEFSCLIYGGRWRATFEGRPQESEEFYRIILSSTGGPGDKS